MKTFKQSIQMGMLCLIALLLTNSLTAQTSLRGKVTDADKGEPILFGNVALYKNGIYITDVETDFDGNYNITNIDAGTYEVEVRYVGYQKHGITGVPILIDKANKLNIEIKSGSNLEDLGLVSVYVPLMQQDDIIISTESSSVITADQIKALPIKKINGLVQSTAGVASAEDGGDLTVRSDRKDPTEYYVRSNRLYSKPKVIVKPPTFILNILTQIASLNAISLDFEITEKGNITIQLFNSRRDIVYDRTTFMDTGKQAFEIDFMDTKNIADIYQLIVTHENGFQKIESITLQ